MRWYRDNAPTCFERGMRQRASILKSREPRLWRYRIGLAMRLALLRDWTGNATVFFATSDGPVTLYPWYTRPSLSSKYRPYNLESRYVVVTAVMIRVSAVALFPTLASTLSMRLAIMVGLRQLSTSSHKTYISIACRGHDLSHCCLPLTQLPQ